MTVTSHTPEPKKYDLIITLHARERWVERIVDPDHYRHLSECAIGCDRCISILHDLHHTLRASRRQIDGRIVACWRKAKQDDSRVRDISFLEAMEIQYGDDIAYLDFLLCREEKAVLMVIQRPDEATPTLLTVLTVDMIEGTIFRKLRRHPPAGLNLPRIYKQRSGFGEL